LPISLFKSFRDNFAIDYELRRYDPTNTNLPINIALYYFKAEDNFYHYFGGPTGGG
jgi:hypothetical protein